MANDLIDNWKIAWILTENLHHDPSLLLLSFFATRRS